MRSTTLTNDFGEALEFIVAMNSGTDSIVTQTEGDYTSCSKFNQFLTGAANTRVLL